MVAPIITFARTVVVAAAAVVAALAGSAPTGRQWQRFRRTGIVTAARRPRPCYWTTDSGEIMAGAAGDWAVSDDAGRTWLVRDDIFHATYQRVDKNQWRRSGFVRARPVRDGEIIQILEGPITATAGGWVVEGAQGEQWVVPTDQFACQYVAEDSP